MYREGFELVKDGFALCNLVKQVLVVVKVCLQRLNLVLVQPQCLLIKALPTEKYTCMTYAFR